MNFNEKLYGIDRILSEDVRQGGKTYKGMRLNELTGAEEGTPVNFIMRIEKVECAHCIKEDNSNPALIDIIDRLKLLNVIYCYDLIDRSNPIYVGINNDTKMFSRVKTKENSIHIENGMVVGILGCKINSDDIHAFVCASYFEYLGLKEDNR